MRREPIGHTAKLAALLFALHCLPTQQLLGNSFIGIAGSNSAVTFSEANAVSADGMIVVGRSSDGAVDQAFVWTAASGLLAIEQTSSAFGVSGDGRVVVGISNSGPSGKTQPFRWTQSEGVQFMGGLPGEALQLTFATDASFDGSVIVGSTTFQNTDRAFRWTEPNGFQLLNAGNSPNFLGDNAAAVSDDGNTIVGYDAPRQQAYRWTPQAGKTFFGSNSTFPNDVSADGTVIVGEDNRTAFRWTEQTGIVPLISSPQLSPYSISSVFSYSLATTQSGEAIVGSSNGTTATIWTQAYGTESLSLVLQNRYGLSDALLGWQLWDARDISPDGRAIVGIGRNPNGLVEGWLVRLDRPIFVPEPSSFVLVLLVATLSLICYRRTQLI